MFCAPNLSLRFVTVFDQFLGFILPPSCLSYGVLLFQVALPTAGSTTKERERERKRTTNLTRGASGEEEGKKKKTFRDRRSPQRMNEKWRKWRQIYSKGILLFCTELFCDDLRRAFLSHAIYIISLFVFAKPFISCHRVMWIILNNEIKSNSYFFESRENTFSLSRNPRGSSPHVQLC